MSPLLSLYRRDNDDESLLLFPEASHLPTVRDGLEPAVAWLPNDEGQLAVDVYDGDDEIVIRSAIAGVNPEDLEVILHNDMLTIRGRRDAAEPAGRPLLRECHWGSFSRSLILPTEIDAESITATITDGVLMVRLPKILRSRRIAVRGN